MLRFTAMEEGDDPEALFAMEYDHMARMVVDAASASMSNCEALAFDLCGAPGCAGQAGARA